MGETIDALTFDIQTDGWKQSRGFIKRAIPQPHLEERNEPADSVSVIVHIRFAGLCGSDRGIWTRTAFSEMITQSLAREHKTMRILGHEFVGEVVDAGSMVEHLYGIRVGEMVSGDSHVTCGRCFQCRIGEQETCQDQAILGITIDGIFAPRVKIPAKNLWAVDFTRVRPEVCALYDPFGNAVHALSKVDVRGARVAIFGCGQVGMFSILLARTFGAAKIIGIDVNAENLERAQRLGAHTTILVEEQPKTHPAHPDTNVIDAIHRVTYGKGVDVSMEMCGTNASVNNCIAATRYGGDVLLFGIKDGDFVIPQYSRMVVKGLTLHSVIGRQIFQTWQTAQRVLSDHSNAVQEKIWDIILNRGQETIIPLSAFRPELLEERMAHYPKLLFDMHA